PVFDAVNGLLEAARQADLSHVVLLSSAAITYSPLATSNRSRSYPCKEKAHEYRSVDHRGTAGHSLPGQRCHEANPAQGEAVCLRLWMGRRLQRRHRQGHRRPRGPGCGGSDPARRARHRAGPGAAGRRRSGVADGRRVHHARPPSRGPGTRGDPGPARPGRLRGVGPLRPPVLHRLTQVARLAGRLGVDAEVLGRYGERPRTRTDHLRLVCDYLAWILATVGRQSTGQGLTRREPERRYPILLTLVALSAVDLLDVACHRDGTGALP